MRKSGAIGFTKGAFHNDHLATTLGETTTDFFAEDVVVDDAIMFSYFGEVCNFNQFTFRNGEVVNFAIPDEREMVTTEAADARNAVRVNSAGVDVSDREGVEIGRGDEVAKSGSNNDVIVVEADAWIDEFFLAVVGDDFLEGRRTSGKDVTMGAFFDEVAEDVTTFSMKDARELTNTNELRVEITHKQGVGRHGAEDFSKLVTMGDDGFVVRITVVIVIQRSVEVEGRDDH